jgi:hypothetical protein
LKRKGRRIRCRKYSSESRIHVQKAGCAIVQVASKVINTLIRCKNIEGLEKYYPLLISAATTHKTLYELHTNLPECGHPLPTRLLSDPRRVMEIASEGLA